MTTEAQLTANRQNAQRSTGPRTDAGKRTSSMNALRHNLTGQTTAMTDEDRSAQSQFYGAFIQSLAPEGALELQIAQRIVTDSWRLNRISAVEDNLFALGFFEHAGEIDTESPELHAALAAARTFQAQSKQLQLLTLYEQRINRSLHKNLATLQALQSARKAQRQTRMGEAKKLLQLSEMKGLSYEPSRDGFVFSNAEIRAVMDRERRLQWAEKLDFRRHKRQKRQTLAA